MKLAALSNTELAQSLAELNFNELKMDKLNLAEEASWFIEDDKLTKNFEFKSFQAAFGFMTMCALYCDKVDHHPEWKNCYNRVYVQLTTHSVKGISVKDFELADHMDKVFMNFTA